MWDVVGVSSYVYGNNIPNLFGTFNAKESCLLSVAMKVRDGGDDDYYYSFYCCYYYNK